jgi:thioredoxin 1
MAEDGPKTLAPAVTQHPDGTWRVSLDVLGVEGSGATQEEAMAAFGAAFQSVLESPEAGEKLRAAGLGGGGRGGGSDDDGGVRRAPPPPVPGARDAMEGLRSVTAADFDAAVLAASPRAVLVDFWADWCAPCIALAPVLREVSVELADRLEIVKVDVEAHPELSERFGVLAMPTLLLLVDGAEAARMVGSQPKDVILGRLEGLLAR